MCGIFGYTGKSKDGIRQCIQGLKKVEYRGYDSSGIVFFDEGVLRVVKEKGKIAALEVLLGDTTPSSCAVAHTRWATHGQPSRVNAHPHTDQSGSIALVHNGIIENYQYLRAQLLKLGDTFQSDTDSEVIAHLLGHADRGNLFEAIHSIMNQMEGAYAVVFVHKDYPGELFAFTVHAPLAIGISSDASWISSDPNALPPEKEGVIFLGDREIARVRPGECEVMNIHGEIIKKTGENFHHFIEEVTKEGFEHYTLKEIHEQPHSVANALFGRLIEEYGTASLEGLESEYRDFHTIQSIVIIGCGSSLHAGMIGARILEEKARIPTSVQISSEFRYQNPVVPPNTLVIAISQSGETADTIAAMREMRAKGARVIALCNVAGSTISREAQHTIFLRAGAEIGVCSTKAFSNQVMVLNILALLIARMRHLSKEEGQIIVEGMKRIPEQIRQVLDKESEIAELAKKYSAYEEFFFLGRQYMYPTALEGALKLKEISYINANGYPAGEMKHGPIALIDSFCPTFAFATNMKTYPKMVSNLMEVKARGGPLIVVTFEGIHQGLEELGADIIEIPLTLDYFAPITASIVGQLFAYHIAKERGEDIDQPRNLAKSVTVE